MKKSFYGMMICLMSLFCVSNAKSFTLPELQQAIKDKGAKWTAGHTSVSDLSDEEKAKLCSTMPTPPEILSGHEDKREVKGKLKAAIDWRNYNGKNWMTPVKNQGNCGSCWAFGTIGGFEARLKIAYEKPDTNIDLSEQFLVSCDDGNGGCMGGSLGTAATFVQATGVPPELCFPYQESDLACTQRCSNWQSQVVKPFSWNYMSTGNIAQYKQALQDGPMGCQITAKKDFFYYTGGVYSPVLSDSGDKTLYNHGVTLCGYDDSRGGTGAWLIKNSYSTGWGEAGYGWIAYGSESSEGPGLPVYFIILDNTNPRISLNNKTVLEPDNNIWDPGEQISIIVNLRNLGLTASNVVGVVSTTNGSITVNTNSANFGSIATNGLVGNSSTPYKATASLGASIPQDVSFSLHITADGGYLKDTSFTVRLGCVSGDTLKSFASPAGTVYGLAFDGTNLWASISSDYKIYKLDPITGQQISFIGTPNSETCTDISWDKTDGNLWVHSRSGKKIYKVNSSTGAVITSFASPATYPTGLAFDGTNLWAVDMTGYKIYEVSQTGTIVSSFDIPLTPPTMKQYAARCLAFDSRGANGGSLLLAMTYLSSATVCDSVVVWELTKTGGIVGNHRIAVLPQYGRAIDVNPSTDEYWVNSETPAKIYKVNGCFYGTPVEESNKFMSDNSKSLVISPNPSQSKTSISFNLPKTTKVTINIYDKSGKFIYALVNKELNAGSHTIKWDGKGIDGKMVSAGIYFYKINWDGCSCTRKSVIIE
ncbi:MAG: C1 family peptidase [bacterium]